MGIVVKGIWVATKWSVLLGLIGMGILVWLARRSLPKPGDAASWSPRF
jgi:hypothetical protein